METYVVLDTTDTVLDRLLLALDNTNTRQTIECWQVSSDTIHLSPIKLVQENPICLLLIQQVPENPIQQLSRRLVQESPIQQL